MTNFILNLDGHKPFMGRLEKLIDPVPVPIMVVRGDEELAEYKFRSRTSLDNGWTAGPWTPSVFRYDKSPVKPKSDYRVDITPMKEAIRKLNAYNEKALDYLFSPTTAIYNKTGDPKQAYITMSGNKLQVVEIVGNYLKFKTLIPSSNVAGMTAESHPQFVHTFDLVGWVKNDITRQWQTLHKPNTPQGIIHYFLVTKEGYAYIPLDKVKPA